MACLLPEHGMAIGYAVTCELTTHDPDGPVIPWNDYYDFLDQSPGPMVAIIKDVDTRAGRGAAFGDGMAAVHKQLGVTGVIVDGSVRDLVGIDRVGLPVWGTGLTPGHGVFSLVRHNQPITVNQLLVHPGEIVAADRDGVVKTRQVTTLPKSWKRAGRSSSESPITTRYLPIPISPGKISRSTSERNPRNEAVSEG